MKNGTFLMFFLVFPITGAYRSYTKWKTPRFLHDTNEVNISVSSDSTVFLHCKVTGLRDQSVSWYRRKGDEIQLLTVGFHSYHNDNRFALMYEHPSDWRLRLLDVQDRDEGTYECQVSSDPPLTRAIHLFVLVPAIQILDDRGVQVGEKYYQRGSNIELQCVVSALSGLSSLDIIWQRGIERLNYDVKRGGVNVRTELKESSAKSWLLIGGARIEDSAEYFCNASDIAIAKVNIHVLPDETPAAIQRARRESPSLMLLFLIFLKNHVFWQHFT